jgi:excisionase family DNA binding protein
MATLSLTNVSDSERRAFRREALGDAEVVDHERLAYTLNDACRMLGVGRSTLYAMLARGDIAYSQVGGRKLIPHEELVALLQRNMKRGGAA